MGVSTDEAADALEVPNEVADSHPNGDMHANGTTMNDGLSFPLKAGLTVCLLQHQQRDALTPSPINFCDDLNWGPLAEPARSLRETSVSSETSIRTADGLLDDDSKASGCSSVSPTHNVMSPESGVTPDDGIMSPVMSQDDIQVEIVEVVQEPREQSESPPQDKNDVGNTVEPQLLNQDSGIRTANSPTSASSPVINIEQDVITQQEVVEEVATASAATSNMAAPLAMVKNTISSPEPKGASAGTEAVEEGHKEEAVVLAKKETAKEESEGNVPVVADEDNEMEEQLELMRNHLRHSRRRYSMRHKKRRPQQLEPGSTGSLDRRIEGSGDHSNSPGLQRSATISGARRAYLKGLYGKTEGEGTSVDARRKSPAAQGVSTSSVLPGSMLYMRTYRCVNGTFVRAYYEYGHKNLQTQVFYFSAAGVLTYTCVRTYVWA